ncbi:MAG: hypothetical protein ACTHJK_00995 [Sphingomicrobium sp.]
MNQPSTSPLGPSGPRMLTAGIAVLALGAGPLLLYIAYGPADGNPIGLGLLAMVAVPVGGILAGFGLLRMAVDYLVRRAG